jgi:hypothetical protein
VQVPPGPRVAGSRPFRHDQDAPSRRRAPRIFRRQRRSWSDREGLLIHHEVVPSRPVMPGGLRTPSRGGSIRCLGIDRCREQRQDGCRDTKVHVRHTRFAHLNKTVAMRDLLVPGCAMIHAPAQSPGEYTPPATAPATHRWPVGLTRNIAPVSHPALRPMATLQSCRTRWTDDDGITINQPSDATATITPLILPIASMTGPPACRRRQDPKKMKQSQSTGH